MRLLLCLCAILGLSTLVPQPQAMAQRFVVVYHSGSRRHWGHYHRHYRHYRYYSHYRRYAYYHPYRRHYAYYTGYRHYPHYWRAAHHRGAFIRVRL